MIYNLDVTNCDFKIGTWTEYLSMPMTNRDRVGKGLDLVTAGLQPFVERELKAVHGERWMKAAQQSFRDGRGAGKVNGVIQWDP